MADAIRWYEKVIATAEGNISFRTLEQVSNLRIRRALDEARSAQVEQERLAAPASGRTSARDRATANTRLRAAISTARGTIKDEMKRLNRLTAFQDTVERASMRGSAMKRLAMLELAAGRGEAARRAIGEMASYYKRGVEIARDRKADNLFYPALNLIVAEVALHAGNTKWKGLPTTLFDDARASVAAKNKSNPDFWSLVAVPELQLYEAVSRGNLNGKRAADILRSFKDVFQRSRGGSDIASVADTMHFALDPYVARPVAKAAVRAVLTKFDGLIKSLRTASS